MKWSRTPLGHYVSRNYELIPVRFRPVGFRRQREGYVVLHRSQHIDLQPNLASAKACAERHAEEKR